ncbi:hypothetical protein HXX76_012911 [Chlamydomonas incerta]|uniref:Uncharacterized protein n=1 Tax=Chlamydomonas incerta TaxID=51695 RepID=A0A835VSW3_CHLIN|nr:hypothetical protein HXX76_012911 [Chlamydomonas incerta]|eukprot:KAG2426595.1 hypothetical protein HXX76_012911 [Chlamydomonas incerta]
MRDDVTEAKEEVAKLKEEVAKLASKEDPPSKPPPQPDWLFLLACILVGMAFGGVFSVLIVLTSAAMMVIKK